MVISHNVKYSVKYSLYSTVCEHTDASTLEQTIRRLEYRGRVCVPVRHLYSSYAHAVEIYFIEPMTRVVLHSLELYNLASCLCMVRLRPRNGCATDGV